MRKYTILLISISTLILDYHLSSPTLTVSWIVPALSLVSMGVGALQRNAARRMEAENPFPTTEENENILRNTAIAERMSQTGLPGQEYSLAQQGLQRNLEGVLRQTQQMGGYGVNLPAILRQSNYAQQNLDVQNASARLQNQRLAMDARTKLAGEQNRVWGWNEQARYQQLAQRIASLRSAGGQNIAGGIGFLGQMMASGVWNGFGGSQTNPASQIQTVLPGAQVGPNPFARQPLQLGVNTGFGVY